MRIDFHAHYLPAPYLEALRAGDGPSLAKPNDDATLRAMVELQDAAGIDVQVLSTGPNAPYLRDEALAIAAARTGNEGLAAAVSRHGGRFAAFGCVPMPHAEAATAEAIRCLDDFGFWGLHLGCSALGHPLDEPQFDEFWSELDRRDAVIFLHPGGVVVGTEPGLAGMDDTLIAVTIGSAAEIATAALRMASLCRKRRRIRPIIGLLGGSLPFLLQRSVSLVGKWPFPSTLSQFGAPADVLTELQRFHYEINLLPDPHVLESARRAFGVDRLVFGSNSPSGTPQAAIDFLTQGGVTAAECEAILSANAASLIRPV